MKPEVTDRIRRLYKTLIAKTFFIACLFTPLTAVVYANDGKNIAKPLNSSSHSTTHTCSAKSIHQKQDLFANKGFNFIPVSFTQDDKTDKRETTTHNRLALKNINYHVDFTTPHDTNAYTQGLVYFNSFLYESTGGLGLSELRKVDINTGKIVQRKTLASHYFAEGLARFKQHLIQLTLKKNQALVYDINSLNKLGHFQFTGDGWGLVEINNTLLMSNGTSQLREFNPHTHKQISEHSVTANGSALQGINEMENVNGLIFANIWPSDCIAIIDPETYQVDAWINLASLFPEYKRFNPSAVLNGIAFNPDKQQLLVTGKYWPEVFHLTLIN